MQADLADLAEDTQQQIEDIRAKEEAALEDTEEQEVRLEKTDIQLVAFGLLWVPLSRRV